MIEKKGISKEAFYKSALSVRTGDKFDNSVMTKEASLSKEAASTTEFAETTFYSPRLTPETWFLPRTRKMMLKWVKIFFDWDPMVHSILMMHARSPLSEFTLGIENPGQVQFLHDSLHREDWDIMDTLYEASLSLKKFGEAIIQGDWNEDEKKWNSMICLDPALIEVEPVPFTSKVRVYVEIPNKYIRLAKSNKPADKEAKESLPKEVFEAIKKGKKYIQLDTEGSGEGEDYRPPTAIMLINKTDVGEVGLRGFPPAVPLFKNLVFQDFLRKAQYARAQRFAYPVEQWSVGDTSKDIYPDEAALGDIQTMLKKALATPPYSIVWNTLLKYESHSAVGSLLNIYDDLAYCQENLLIGLGVNKNIVLGEGPSFSSVKTMSMNRLIMDYQTERDRFERFLKYFVLKPLCKAGGYTDMDPKTKKEKVKIPQIHWVKSLDMEKEDEEKKRYMDLWKDGALSSQTLFSIFPDLNFETEVRNLEKEVGSILDGGVRKLPKPEKPWSFEDKQKKEKTEVIEPVEPVKPVKPEEEETRTEESK